MRRSKNLSYSLLILIFILIAIITPYPAFSPLEFGLFTLACAGFSWFVTESKIFWVRHLFVEVVVLPDREEVYPQNTIGELLTCPICASAWLALGLLWLPFPNVFIVIGAVMAVVRWLVK